MQVHAVCTHDETGRSGELRPRSDGSFSTYSACIVGCHDDLTCPDGMMCGSVTLEDGGSETEACVWP